MTYMANKLTINFTNAVLFSNSKHAKQCSLDIYFTSGFSVIKIKRILENESNKFMGV